MKKRLLSLFLAFVTLLGILPTAALAANTEEEALGEVDIYNGGYELSYLTINGRIRTQDYTYFNYVDAKGQKKEVPAYCVNPNIKGVPQTVGVGESIKYLANERSSDPKVVGIISNGYPHRSLGELKLDNKYQAYYATKMALWCYLLPNWNIANLKVAPGLTGSELDIGNRILAAAKDIYKRGTTYNYMLEPRMTATPDKSAAYSVTVDGKQYKQQVFTIWSETWVYDYDIAVSFADPGSVPQGTRIVDENDQDITAVTTKWTGDGYGGKFKVLYPADSIEGESGSVQLSLTADVAQYAAMYAVCQEKDKYGNLQNYICDLDNSRHMELAAVSSYTGGGEPDPKETALKIVKLEEGTKIPLEGAVFSVYDPEGRKVGSFSTSPDGTVIIPLTLEGHYTVTEEIPPQYHLLPEERTQHADVEYNKVATLTFWNAPYGSIRVQKLSDTGDALNGVTVQIKHIESGEVQTAKTKIGGVAVFDQLQPGGWEVRELAGISGWIADTDTVQTVSVVAGKTSDVTIINKELPGLRIIKYERGTMKAMPNVSFEIFRDAESLGIFQTDEFGEILLTDCKPATYRAEERDTGGDGHVLDTTPQEVELKAGDGIKKLVFFNDRLPGIHLIKVDSSDLSKPIANAKFRFEAVDGSWGPEEYTTSEDGTIDLSKLPADTAYIVTELDCPGYVIDDAQRIIHLDGGEQAQFVFTNMEMLRREIQTEVIQPALRELPPDEGTEILINPSGRFVLGGFEADTGLTGRKLMVDTYGGLAPHGGGALSGKDGSKVDRSGTYMARYIAKNIVAAGLAEKCTVSLAYAIGKADPVAVDIDTHGSGEYGDDVLAQAVRQVFELTPAGMIRTLGLDKPIFAQFCNYGHFTHQDAPWEQCDCADLLWNVCRVKEAGVSSR